MYNHFLDTFIRAAELGSFSKTAEEMFITPSAVIQQINSLETDLGVKVFNRSKRGVTLTPAGEYLLIEGRAFVQRNHDIRLHLQAINAQMHGQILVGCNPYHMPQMLYEIWPSFYLKNSECLLSSYTFNEMEDLYFSKSKGYPVQTDGAAGSSPCEAPHTHLDRYYRHYSCQRQKRRQPKQRYDQCGA